MDFLLRWKSVRACVSVLCKARLSILTLRVRDSIIFSKDCSLTASAWTISFTEDPPSSLPFGPAKEKRLVVFPILKIQQCSVSTDPARYVAKFVVLAAGGGAATQRSGALNYTGDALDCELVSQIEARVLWNLQSNYQLNKCIAWTFPKLKWQVTETMVSSASFRTSRNNLITIAWSHGFSMPWAIWIKIRSETRHSV